MGFVDSQVPKCEEPGVRGWPIAKAKMLAFRIARIGTSFLAKVAKTDSFLANNRQFFEVSAH
jgi:hypothetical protein